MLYIFAGFPQNGLNAGGLQHAVETVEELALLQQDPAVQHRKEGVFAIGRREERIGDDDHHLSELCLDTGITWEWFPENWSFGNGITIHKTTANRDHALVVHHSQLPWEQHIRQTGGPVKLGELELSYQPQEHESWKRYESRWELGTCPQVSHIVHLTWLVTSHRLPQFAYDRIRALVEGGGSQPLRQELFTEEHFSESRLWEAKPNNAGRNHALSTIS